MLVKVNNMQNIKIQNIGKKISNGAYGEVMSIGETAGKIFNDTLDASTIREMAVLSHVDHPNIVNVLGYNFTNDRLILIMEKANHNLEKKINTYNEESRAVIIFQILNALSFLHKNNIAHRDIKPENILIFNTLDVKLCDFGLSKPGIISGLTHTNEVTTMWYRAPEVILDNGNYNVLIDIWSVGIILLRMILKEKFKMIEYYEITTLFKIFNLIGTPSEENWSGLSKMKFWKDSFPKMKGNIDEILSSVLISTNEKELLKKMLSYPLDRINAHDALCHPYFDNIKLKYNVDKLKTIGCFKKVEHLKNICNLENISNFYENIKILFSWLIEVTDELNISYSTLFTTFNIINKYIKTNIINKTKIQLIGIACISIVCKLLEVKIFNCSDWIYLCDSCYTKKQLKKQISDILIYFNFNILPMVILYKDSIKDIIATKKDIFLNIICCSMSNNYILEKINFEEIIEYTKCIINDIKSPETTFLYLQIKNMEECKFKKDILNYITTYLKNIEVNKPDVIISKLSDFDMFDNLDIIIPKSDFNMFDKPEFNTFDNLDIIIPKSDFNMFDKPEFIIPKSDFNMFDKPEFIIPKSDFNMFDKPDFNMFDKQDFNMFDKQEFIIPKSDFNMFDKQEFIIPKSDFNMFDKPDFNMLDKPDFNMLDKPDFNMLDKPEFNMLDKPEFNMFDKQEFNMFDKPDFNMFDS
jgi:serine/threonine protein kinase